MIGDGAERPATLPSGALITRLRAKPRAANQKAAKRRLADVLDGQAVVDGERLRQFAGQKMVHDLLLGIADHSSYLWRLVVNEPSRLVNLLAMPPEDSLLSCIRTAEATCDASVSADEVMHALRRAKQRAALLIALADLGGVWSLAEVTRALTLFADTAVSCALRFLLREAEQSNKLSLADPHHPERDCGVVVLALGKHGARELNYSSDVDLIVLFDSQTPSLKLGAEPTALFVGMTKRLVRLLQERTPDGYVLRVDLRLRPDPGSTAIAISLATAFSYYETLGQNWERAALIKARPVAGERGLGERFIADLAPFIWRKYFDYAAIADIHAMKRQIHAFHGHTEVSVAGHDVKLGRGGIREVEFFVQTQQLIFGGRRANLRGPRTLEMLVALQRDGWIAMDAVEDLTSAYIHLRTIEHRLQMLRDEQTQRLPTDPGDLQSLAAFCGYRDFETFSDDLTSHLRRVERHYARLFEHAPGLAAESGNLVFTGVTNDPATLSTLRGLGFSRAEQAAETIRGWHFGRRSAVQTPRAREVLTELIPVLLQSFAESGDPDAAVAAFDQALSRMPAAVELFSILRSNDKVRQLFSDILGAAPRLAQIVAMRPHVLDAAIDPDLLNPRADDQSFDRRVRPILAQAISMEDFLDRMRDLGQEEMFLIGVRLLAGVFDPRRAGEAYSALAASLVRATFSQVSAAFRREHGVVPGGGCAIVGMGKLGSREMTAASDLDLILLYAFDADRPESDGVKPLHAVQYYTRLTQRIVSALTAPTRRGRLYDVDMRLRPSGGKGPVATQLSRFADYQASEAETWEHMSLVRARVVAGDPALGAAASTAIRRAITTEREPNALRRDVVDMRDLIAEEKGDANPWDLKLASGGIIDIEFLGQYLALRYAVRFPDLLDVATDKIIAKAQSFDLIGNVEATTLAAAHRLYSAATQMMRVTVDGPFDPARVGEGVRRQIARGSELPDFRTLQRELAAARTDVRRIFQSVLRAGG